MADAAVTSVLEAPVEQVEKLYSVYHCPIEICPFHYKQGSRRHTTSSGLFSTFAQDCEHIFTTATCMPFSAIPDTEKGRIIAAHVDYVENITGTKRQDWVRQVNNCAVHCTIQLNSCRVLSDECIAEKQFNMPRFLVCAPLEQLSLQQTTVYKQSINTC